MAPLPPHTPSWAIWLLNGIVLAAMVLIGLALKWGGGSFAWGFVVGLLFMYFAVRIKYGFWPFNER